MQSPQLETKGQQNKRIAVSPQLETKGQQNKRIVQQNGKQSQQLRAKVIQRKQQNVKQSPQLEFVQSETKSHQIKEMRKQADMQYRQSRNLQNEHQPDNSKHQPQLVDSSCQDSSVATSEANYPQSDNIQNQHCLGQSYPHLDIRTFQPQQVDTSHQESSTSREDLDSTSNQQDAKQTTQGLMESNQDRANKPYLQLDIRTYQQQQVDTSHQESSDDQTSKEEIVRTINREDSQWMLVPN